MAKRKRKTSAKQRAAARRNIKKAQRAARRGHRRPKHKRAAHRRPKHRGKRRVRGTIRRKNRGRHGGQFVGRGGRIHGRKVRGGYHRAGKIASEGRRRKRHHRRGALENPVGGWEILIGIVTGVAGYSTADLIDRFVVSRDRYQADGKTLKKKRSNTAPLTDDLLVRGGVGVAVAAVPLIGAHFIRTPWIRAALQFFGFGAAFHLTGKAIDDLATYALKDGTAAADGTPSMGQRLFPRELDSRSYVGDGLSGLPNACAGCGRADGLGGMCCKRSLSPSGATSVQRGQPAQPPQAAPPETTVQQPYIPPPIVGRQPGVPATPATPFTPAIPGQPLLTPTNPFVAGMHGLGDATAALRAYPDAYRAIRSNGAALAAVQNNNATPYQRDIAERVATQHSEGIRALSAVEQRQPGSIQAAARGMAGLSDDQPVRKFAGSSKWSRDDAAE